MKAAGDFIEGAAAYESGRFNRRVSNVNATNIQRDQTAEEALIRAEARRAMGVQVAAQAGSGFEAGTGSALDSLRESAVNASLDILISRRKANSGANAELAQGKAAYRAGLNQQSGKIVSGAAKVVEQIASYGG